VAGADHLDIGRHDQTGRASENADRAELELVERIPVDASTVGCAT
jgi:hypothetical protein